MRRLEGHEGPVSAVAIVDHQHVISASTDTTLRLWNIDSGAEVRRFKGHCGEVFDFATLDPRHIVSASGDNTLRLWDLGTGLELARFEGDAAFTRVSPLTDGTVVARDAVARLHFFDVRLTG